MSSHYEVPNWAGKPPVGLHLDVMKENKLIQKLLIDGKKCYHFGRNATLNDFCIDHQSCSRIHSALVFHKHLNRAFLVDLGSTHGTYIGSIRIEANKPTQLPIDTSFHFGASTRHYIIRERPNSNRPSTMDELDAENDVEHGRSSLLGLPESELELDNLTEFNTAHNRRITMMGIPDEEPKKRRKIRLVFAEDEIIINPEDIDPSIGRFRNMIETTVIPKKRSKNDLGLMGTADEDDKKKSGVSPSKRIAHFNTTSPVKGLYDGINEPSIFSTSLSSKLGLPLPNPAPEIEIAPSAPSAADLSHHPSQSSTHDDIPEMEDPDEPKKKKYAKEAWPGRKPSNSLLV